MILQVLNLGKKLHPSTNMDTLSTTETTAKMYTCVQPKTYTDIVSCDIWGPVFSQQLSRLSFNVQNP